jgi:hypothetical protein
MNRAVLNAWAKLCRQISLFNGWDQVLAGCAIGG